MASPFALSQIPQARTSCVRPTHAAFHTVLAKTVPLACRAPLHQESPRHCCETRAGTEALSSSADTRADQQQGLNAERSVHHSPAAPENPPRVRLGRTRLVTFTCNKCGGRTTRKTNPVAWERGLVIAQCGKCEAWHKLSDAANLVEEVRFSDEDS
ncbi:hypothetical protein WJX74_009544 [Apatococcus lobatus]|uniref:DNL-type domain-containing protein n=2 Tax=Apatococcus TaxID=904362 RepID=A0AAW1SMD4_9CHLO